MRPKIWIMKLDAENYRLFKATPEAFEKWLLWFDKLKSGGSVASEWEVVEMVLFEGEPGEKRKERKKPIADFTNGYVYDSCSERARQIIEPLVKGQVEFLPLKTPVGIYYEMNIQRIACLDEENAIVKRFKDGQIMRAEKYAFLDEKLGGQHIFWEREIGIKVTFVSDEFKRLVEENGLTGLLFYPVPLVEE